MELPGHGLTRVSHALTNACAPCSVATADPYAARRGRRGEGPEGGAARVARASRHGGGRDYGDRLSGLVIPIDTIRKPEPRDVTHPSTGQATGRAVLLAVLVIIIQDIIASHGQP